MFENKNNMDCLPQVHVVAIHAERGYKAATPGIGLMCRRGEDHLLGAGAYRNSLDKGSAYLAGGWQPLKAGNWRFGIIAGAVTGYTSKPVALAAGFISYRHIHLTVIPEVKGKTPATVGLSFTWR